MDLNTNIIPVVYIRHLLAVCSEQGITTEQLLEGTSLLTNDVNVPGLYITHAQQMQILINAARLAPEPDIGLRMGEKYRAQDQGIYGLVVLTSVNFHQAMKTANHFAVLAGGYTDSELTITDDEYRIRATESYAMSGTHQMLVDEFICGWHSVISHLVDQPIMPLRVTLDYPKPVHTERYRDFFCCPVQFSATHSELVYPRVYGDILFKYHDIEAHEACAQRCESLLQRIQEAKDMAGRVRKILLQLSCSRRSAEMVANRLHISPRHLRRLLHEEGTSFKTVLNEVLYTLAKNYLEQTALTIEQMAPLIGYNETNNFRRAFKRWSGLSPTEFRNQLWRDNSE